MSKKFGRLSEGGSAALREEVRPSKVGGYELVLWAAKRCCSDSVPTIAKQR